MFSSGWIYVIILVQSVWKGIGWGSIVYLAAISGIDQTLYEAAKMDGANDFQLLFKIVMPLSKATVAVIDVYKRQLYGILTVKKTMHDALYGKLDKIVLKEC